MDAAVALLALPAQGVVSVMLDSFTSFTGAAVALLALLAQGVVSFMLDSAPAIGTITTTEAVKRQVECVLSILLRTITTTEAVKRQVECVLSILLNLASNAGNASHAGKASQALSICQVKLVKRCPSVR